LCLTKSWNAGERHFSCGHRILSLVFPSYGRETRGFLHGVGVHEWQNGYWHRLDPDSAKKRICPSDGEVRVEDMR